MRQIAVELVGISCPTIATPAHRGPWTSRPHVDGFQERPFLTSLGDRRLTTSTRRSKSAVKTPARPEPRVEVFATVVA